LVIGLNFGHWSIAGLLGWYVLGFGAAPLAAEAWSRASRRSLPIAMLEGHLFVFYSYVWFLASIVACWNILRGRRAWVKTSRVAPTLLRVPTQDKEAA
jgi:hypothetical protein